MPSTSEELIISFSGATADEGNRYSRDLRSFLLDIDPSARLELRREQSDSQDFGSTLVLVLGTTAASALARGIAVWLQRNSGVRISLANAKGELVASGVDSKDVSRIIQAFTGAST
jgi:hypothetical protein